MRQAKLSSGEDTPREQERTRLSNAGRLAELAGAIHDALAGGAGSGGGAGDAPGAIDLLGQAGHSLAQLLRIDPQLGDRETLLVEAAAQVEELAQAVRAYQESIEFAPDRLAEVEERLDLLHTLQRKYGETIDDVQRFAEAAGVELEGLVNREQRTVELEGQAGQLEAKIGTA